MVHTFVTPPASRCRPLLAFLRIWWARHEAASLGPQPLRTRSSSLGDRESDVGTSFLHVQLTDMRDADGVREELQLGPVRPDGEDCTWAAINAVLSALSGNLRTLRKTSRPSAVDVLRTFQGLTKIN